MINEYSSQEEPIWEDRQVTVGLEVSDYEEAANRLKITQDEFFVVEANKRALTDKLKELKVERDKVIKNLSEKKKTVVLKTTWKFDWEKGKKKLLAIKEVDGFEKVIDILEEEITEDDRQLRLLA